MTRIDSVRHAADVTKDSVRHAAEVAAPYATTARAGAVYYAQQAGTYGRQAGTYGRQAGARARQKYEARLAPRVGQAREQAWAAVPPKYAQAMETAARRTRDTAQAAAEYTAPRVGSAVAQARAVAGPAREQAVLRGGAALHALRGQVTADDIDRLVRRRRRRATTGRALRGVFVLSVLGGAVAAAWNWWNKQTNPDWLVEPTEPTEPGDRSTLNGSGTLTVVDPLDSGDGSGGTSRHMGRVDGSPQDPEGRGERSGTDRPENE